MSQTMTDKKLLLLQLEAKLRHMAVFFEGVKVEKKNAKINSVAFLPINPFCNALEKAADTIYKSQIQLKQIPHIPKKLGRPKTKKDRNFTHTPMFTTEKPIATKISEPTLFTRPPAVYSNTSPYGIAQELLWEQLKK